MKLIHNRFENIVIERIQAEASKLPHLLANPDLLADAACIALNALRPHYIRHNSNFSIHMTEERRAQDEMELSVAVQAALVYLHDGDTNKPAS